MLLSAHRGGCYLADYTFFMCKSELSGVLHTHHMYTETRIVPPSVKFGTNVIWPQESFGWMYFPGAQSSAIRTSVGARTLDISVGQTVTVRAKSHWPHPTHKEPGV